METKVCTSCNEAKPLSEYGVNRSQKSGLTSACRACHRERSAKKYYAPGEKEKQQARRRKWIADKPGYQAEASRKWRQENPELYKDHLIKTNYGLPLGSYDRMLSTQGGKCAICGTDEPGGKGRFHVDHDHSTKIVRGLLCHCCNLGIGYLKHSKEILEASVSYLMRMPS